VSSSHYRRSRDARRLPAIRRSTHSPARVMRGGGGRPGRGERRGRRGMIGDSSQRICAAPSNSAVSKRGTLAGRLAKKSPSRCAGPEPPQHRRHQPPLPRRDRGRPARQSRLRLLAVSCSSRERPAQNAVENFRRHPAGGETGGVRRGALCGRAMATRRIKPCGSEQP